MSGSERMAAIRAKTLQNLNLSQEEMSIYGAEVKEKYENAMKIGNITCAYRKVMFLGDSGVGKTSSRKLLMGIPHSERDGESTFGIEQYFVDGSYKKIDNSRYTEVQQAASYFTILGTSNLLTHIATPIYILLLNGVILMVTFFITGIITFILLCLHGIRLGFTPLLLLAVVPVSILWKNDIEGFNQGNGLAIILVILNYISTIMLPEMCSGIRTMEKYDALWAILSRTFISSGVFALLSASLGTGGRAGMAVALCTLIPPAYKGIVTQLAQTHSFNLKSGENEIMNILQIIFLFLSFVLGVLIQSKFHNMKRRILICVCSLTSALTMLVMMVSMKIESELLLATCTGVIYGFSFVRGLTFGHRLRRLFGHSRLLVIVYGWEVGMLGGIYMGWRFSWTALFTDGWYLFLAILGCTIAIASEIRRHYLIRNDSVPAQLIWDIKCSNPTTWPQRLCLLDCSGNELYHVGHHIFMAKHSIYLVVFSLEDAYERPDWQMERILYWLNSVFAHAHHRDSLIFLIGTHRASLDNNQTNGIASMMKRELYPVFGGRLALNSSRNECPLFTLENRYRECNGWDTDIDELKEMILKTTREAEYANRLIPVKWLGFLDYVKTIRRNYRRDCIVSYFDLWSKMKEDIGFEKEAHFLRMLEFFNDYGEIFFKSNDPRLFRYVLLEPQILADCVESLAGNYLTVVPKHLESAWNSLCRTGVTSPALLRFMLQNTVGDLDCILDILRAVNLIIPFSTESEEMFIVPYRLPLSVNESVLPVCKLSLDFYFDFGYFYPEAMFLTLLAKCYQMSIGTFTPRLFKDCGIFKFGPGVFCKLELMKASIGQNLIKTTIGEDKMNKEDIFRTLRWVDEIINLIRLKQFPFLKYSCGITCHCSYNNKLHLSVLSTHGGSLEQNFTGGELKFICNGVIRTIAIPPNIQQNSIDQENVSPLDTKAYVEFETFISSSEEDDAWVQCELVALLETAEQPFCDLLCEKPSVATRMNYSTNPDPGYSANSRSSIINITREDIIMSKTMIAVLSRNYYNDARCMAELRVAFNTGKRVIPIIIDSSLPPTGLLDTVRCLDYQRCLKDDALMAQFYIPIIKAIKS